LNLVAETLRIEPIYSDYEIELVGQTFDRLGTKPQQRRSFPTADLRTDRARQKPLPAGGTCGFEQKAACSQGAGAAAAHDCKRNTALCHARSLFFAVLRSLETRQNVFWYYNAIF